MTSGSEAVGPRTVGVRVPATSANLGPGFDALAVALDVGMTVETTARGPRRVQVLGSGADELPDGDDNLVWRAFAAYHDWAGVAVPDVSLRSHSDIPLERGMGSSAAAAVAGMALARAVVAVRGDAGRRGSDQDLITLATELEGHADNAAAAVLGGVVVCVQGRSLRFPPAQRLRPVLCVPDTRLSTSTARALLPDAVSHTEAARNGARTAVVLAGLIGAMAWEPSAMTDVLHEPARFAAMPGSGRLVGGLRDAGLGACLSGAGPSVLAIVPAGDRATIERIRAVAGAGWHVRPSQWDRAGATIRRPPGDANASGPVG